jgi:hypothetical protein
VAVPICGVTWLPNTPQIYSSGISVIGEQAPATTENILPDRITWRQQRVESQPILPAIHGAFLLISEGLIAGCRFEYGQRDRQQPQATLRLSPAGRKHLTPCRAVHLTGVPAVRDTEKK